MRLLSLKTVEMLKMRLTDFKTTVLKEEGCAWTGISESIRNEACLGEVVENVENVETAETAETVETDEAHHQEEDIHQEDIHQNDIHLGGLLLVAQDHHTHLLNDGALDPPHLQTTATNPLIERGLGVQKQNRAMELVPKRNLNWMMQKIMCRGLLSR